MSQLVPAPGSGTEAQELQRAFDAFNQVSQALTQAYQGLQGRVESLTAELALANGELRRQYEAKEALSERLSLLLNALPAGVMVLDSAGLRQ
jgi:two-component system sensor histidine kinase FlrB